MEYIFQGGARIYFDIQGMPIIKKVKNHCLRGLACDFSNIDYVWSPYYDSHVWIIEEIQLKFIKYLPFKTNLQYDDGHDHCWFSSTSYHFCTYKT